MVGATNNFEAASTGNFSRLGLGIKGEKIGREYLIFLNPDLVGISSDFWYLRVYSSTR